MNTIKCQIFLKTIELGSFTRAAEAMGYTQSAVSRSIADLEREWNMTLLSRNKDGIVLNSQGRELLPYIQSLCNAERALEDEIAEMHELTRGTLRVGTFTSVSIQWLPPIMKGFLNLYPEIRFELVNKWEFAEVEDLIIRGEVDCGFLGLPVSDALESFFLFQDRLLSVLPIDHPLAEADYYPMSRFRQDHYIRTQEAWDKEFSRIFQEEGLRPNIRYTVNDDFTILAMVEQGLGISIQPELVINGACRQLAAIPLEKPRFRQIGLAVRSKEPLAPLTRRFIDYVLQWHRENPQPNRRSVKTT